MNKNKRIYQIAIELNISHTDILEFLEGIGEKGYSHMSEVNTSVYSKIISKYSRDKKKQEVYVKEKARNNIQTSRNIEKKAAEDKKEDKKVILPSPKKDINPIGLKIIEMPNKDGATKIEKKSEEKTKADNKSLDKNLKVIKSKKNTLKKINIADIADKINQSKKPIKPGKDLSKQSLKMSGKKISKKKRKKISQDNTEILTEDNLKKSLSLPEFSTLEELARSMNVKVQEVIMKCMDLGMMATINQRLDMDSMIMIADEFSFEVLELEVDEHEKEEDFSKEEMFPRAPVVTIMGHVDHGKTSLLDYIRNENVVAGESGGITQHIGAYKVSLDKEKDITFLDTPGHEAFTAMRARGAKLTDIVVVVVAADDSVMPQTIEAIDHSIAASVPIIIAVNKIDKPGANPDAVFKKLADHKILVEEWGGKYQSQLISAKTGDGIEGLLEKIILEADVLDLKAPRECDASCVVVESRLDRGLGPVATALVQKGTLKKGAFFSCGSQSSKIRSILDERGKNLESAFPSDPVQILGFEKVPNAGEILKIYKDEKEAKKIATQKSQLQREAEHQRFNKTTLEEIGKEISEGKVKDLNIIIKGDVDGSIEALSDSLMGIESNEVSVKIIHRSVGTINENDIGLAKASNAIIIAFNLPVSKQIKTKAKEHGIDIRSYSIIYEVISEIRLALEGLLDADEVEENLGVAEVRDSFKIPKIGMVAGCMVTEGKVVRNAFLRVKREGEIIHEGNLTSLKRFKDDVAEVLESYECGIGVAGFSKFKQNDIIEVFEIKEIKRTL